MTIDDQIGDGVDARFLVSFYERKLSDILAIDENDRTDERNFAAVERFSELSTELYEIGVRPLVQAMVTPQVAELLRRTHPARLTRAMFGDANPTMKGVGDRAEKVRAARRPADSNNPLLFMERLWAQSVENTFDLFRDWRDAIYEATFFSVYGSPQMLRLGEPFAFERTRKDPKLLRFLPEVQQILRNLDRGGFEDAVIRMLILMAESRGTVRRDRLERSAKVLGHDEPFASLGAEKRTALIHEQSVIVEFEPDLALKTLPDLLPEPGDRQRAIQVVEFIAGAIDEMDPGTIHMLQRFHSALGLPPISLAEPRLDPLKISATAERDDFVDVMTTIKPSIEPAKAESAPEAGKPKDRKAREPAE
jgi:hypothetical protein